MAAARHQGPDRRHRADGTLPRPDPARLRKAGIRGPHPSPLHHQAIPPARRSRQQNRRHRPLRHPPRRRQRLRPVGARTRSDLSSASNSWRGTAAASSKRMSCSGSRCSSIYTLTCQDISRCFKDIFDSEMLLWVAKNLGSAAEILQAGIDGLTQQLRKANIAIAQTHPAKDRRLGAIRTFSRGTGITPSPILHRARRRSARQAPDDPSDRERAGRNPLSQTPYVLLLSIPGINVVSAAEFAGEMGPIEHYAKAASDYRQSRLVPVAVSERRGRSPRRPVGATRQPRPAACDSHDRRQPDQV